jgi:hypothetical protein
MLVGSAVHEYIQKLLGSEEYEHEQEIRWTGPSGVTILGHVDSLWIRLYTLYWLTDLQIRLRDIYLL